MSNKRWIDVHNHLDTSNLRLVDAICTLKGSIERAKEIGLKGIAFTDHECLSQSIEICKAREANPDLRLAIGNEIYLTDTRDRGQKYYHFILVAKDKIGHKQLRELSSRAWLQGYVDRRMKRVPTLKSELAEVIGRDKGHIVATSACLGSELSIKILEMEKARKVEDEKTAAACYQDIVNFMDFVLDLFGEDFYIELPPGASKEQIIVNNKLFQIAKVYNVKCEISCDSHYLKKEDRFLHEAFLKSVDGEREVASFYEYSYMQDETDIIKNMEASFGGITQTVYEHCCETSKEIYDKIEEYDLRHNQTIPKVDIPSYPKDEIKSALFKSYPNLSKMFVSNDDYNRYWVNECFKGFENKKIDINTQTEYLDELEKEADIKRTVGERLGTNIFRYPIVLKHYIDMMWEMGSTVGAGRGSAGAGLNHWLLGITQSNPLRYGLPFERYMNWDTAGLPDIDLDMCPSKRPAILQKIKEDRAKDFREGIDPVSKANLGCTLVATFSTTKPKRAILMACKGYRTEEYPEGIDNDAAQYLASLIPSER